MALKAVRQLHADASRLLTDCDGVIGKGRRVCTRTNVATGGFSSYLGGPWMVEGAYRCYAVAPENLPGLVEVVCACFFGEVTATVEPLLLVGQVRYALDPGQDVKDVCDGWDLWELYGGNCPEQKYGEVLSRGPVSWQDNGKSFEGFKFIAVPLYSINSMDDVVALMDRVRTT